MFDPTAQAATDPQPPFAIPLYKRMWFASVTSQFGGLIQAVGAAWLMVELGGTETQIALVQGSIALPILFLALVSGALADNFERRTVMLVSQIYMMALSVILCIIAWLGGLTPWLLLGLTFMINCGTAINAPSWQATVGDIVPRRSIAAAVAMNSMGFNIARTAGPALGGVIVAAAGAAAAFSLNAISYLGIIFVLFRWRPPKPDTARLKEGMVPAMAAGLRYVLLSPPIRLSMVRGALFGVAASSVTSLMPLIAQSLIGGNATTFGIISAAFGIGAVMGALSNRFLRARFSNEGVVRIALTGMIAGACVVSQSHMLVMTIPGLLLSGAGWLLVVATKNVAVQMSAPRWVVGRSLALFQMAMFGAMATGSWLSGMLAEHHGVANALLIMAAVQSLSLVAGLFLKLPEVESLNLDLTGRWKRPSTDVSIDNRSGPVLVMVRYTIDQADIPAFLFAMQQRRRVRRRDGAKQWTLSRDINDQRSWVEKYRFGRWLDYILHNERQTHADLGSADAIKNLHKGQWPPPVQRLLERQLSEPQVDRAPIVDDPS